MYIEDMNLPLSESVIACAGSFTVTCQTHGEFEALFEFLSLSFPLSIELFELYLKFI